MATNISYSTDRSSQELNVSDPASGSFFSSDLKKHDDLKQMLDSNKDNLKLEAMKRIIAMVARGKDTSELFPPVVKNVVSSNLEVKKLVYVYLVRYAEEQQDLALLSISTFQRALKDPNPLIRACALRVLSSIRVPVIVPIMMLAIKETVTDLSPYVRKTTAHAIPKLYSLDPDQKEELIKILEKLLSDMSTLVVGSAVMAFEEVCPERIDLIHSNYRKLCCLLVDVEEWGQIVIINMLTRYARTQFVCPDKGTGGSKDEEPKDFYDVEKPGKDGLFTMDPDHRLLLTNTRPLLQSRNAAVVLSVAQLYHHIAPTSEACLAARPLVRLMRSHREIQSVVLANMASLSTLRKGMFEPFLKSFYIRSSDPTHIKILKLQVMTNLAKESNISQILREFQTYMSSQDREFVAATINAIGRCASNIKEVTESCLNGLVTLLSHRDELVVGECVIVIRKLLQNESVGDADIISHMARFVDNIKMASAKASILWLLGEYCEKVPKIAPDVLRKMAKTFTNEADCVKLQILSLATKLFLTNPTQTRLLCQYVFNMAKYDLNYDIRDRARFVRALIFPSADQDNHLAGKAKEIFLAPKPPPAHISGFSARDQFQLGTLSHLISLRASGYRDLPDFPEVAPDCAVRSRKESPPPATYARSKVPNRKPKSFYSDEEESSEEETTSGSESEEDSSEEDTDDNAAGKEESDSDETDDSDSTDSSDDTSSDDEVIVNTRAVVASNSVVAPVIKSNLDLLLNLQDAPPTIETPVLTPSLGGMLSPDQSTTPVQMASAAFVPSDSQEILNRISGRGLSVQCRFTRSPHIYSQSMTNIELTFLNHSSSEMKDVCVGTKRLGQSMTIHDFALIPSLAEGVPVHGTIGVDFGDSIQPANFDIIVAHNALPVSITPTIGDLLQPISMNEVTFNTKQAKLCGMNEHSGTVEMSSLAVNSRLLTDRIYQCANVLQVPSTEDNVFKYAAQTTSNKSFVLIKVSTNSEGGSKVTVNSEMMIITSMLFKHLDSALSK